MRAQRADALNAAVRAAHVVMAWVLLCAYVQAYHGSAPRGTADAGFGSGGRVITPIGASDEFATDVAVDVEGRIVVAGYGDFGGTDADFALVRYLPDGQLDASFGALGKVTTPIGTASEDVANAVALQPDGKILLAGYTGSTTTHVALVRYMPNGFLDPTFGTGGKVVTSLGGAARANDMVLQPDGKILVAGRVAHTTTGNDLAVVRYLPNGTLDPTFAVGGVFAPTMNGTQVAYGVILTSDRILVAASSSASFLLAGLSYEGAFDFEFGSYGTVLTAFGGGAYPAGIALQADGKIVLAGDVAVWTPSGTRYGYAVARYHSLGEPDTSFDDDGRAIFSFVPASHWGLAVQVQPTGGIVIAGYSQSDGPGGEIREDATLLRLNGDGTWDAQLGLARLWPDRGRFAGLARQADGKIVAVGHAIEETEDFLVARYHGLSDHIFEDGFEGENVSAVTTLR